MSRQGLTRARARVPITRIRDYLTVSVHDEVDDVLARQLLEDVGEAVRRSNARALVIDVAAVDIMDSFLAGSIRDAAAVARWMGVRTVISGLSPAVAITLLDMGVEIRDVTTTRDLDQALDRLDSEVARDRQLEAKIADVLAQRDRQKETAHANSVAEGGGTPADAERRTPWLLGPRAATPIAGSSR